MTAPPPPEPADPADPGRAGELRARLREVTARIERACAAAGRDPRDVTLIVVTKTYPVSDLRLLAGLGVTEIGENREQEATAKAGACAELGLSLHFVGQLQTNKARSVARYASSVHSVDRAALVEALGRAVRRTQARAVPLDCLVQVSLDGDVARGGVPPDGIGDLADRIAEQDALRLRGLMAVAPLGADPDRAFSVLPALLDGLRGRHPAVDVVSAGMSGDLEAAVRHGATHLRVGTAILGRRVITG